MKKTGKANSVAARPSGEAAPAAEGGQRGERRTATTSSTDSLDGLWGPSLWCRPGVRETLYCLMVFLAAFVVGVTFLGLRRDHPLSRQQEIVARYTLRTKIPFEHVDQKRLEEEQESRAALQPLFFSQDEAMVQLIRDSLRHRLNNLQDNKQGSGKQPALQELSRFFANATAGESFLGIVDEVIGSGIRETQLTEEEGPLPVWKYSGNDVVITSGHRRTLRDFSTLYDVETAKGRIREETAARLGFSGDLSPLLDGVLIPTLYYNQAETEKMREKARAEASIAPQRFRSGAVIIAPSADELSRLQAYSEAYHVTSAHFWRRLTTAESLLRITLMALFMLCYLFCLSQIRPSNSTFRQRVNVSFTAIVIHFMAVYAVSAVHSTFELPLSYLPAMLPIALIPAVLANLLGGRVAICAAVLISILMPLQVQVDNYQYQFLHFALLTALTGVICFRTARKRRDFILGGLVLGLAITFSELIFAMEQGLTPLEMREEAFWILLLSSVNGLMVGMLSLLLLPFFEYVFGLVTQTTLLELSDLSHPLLRRLQLEAPGTYQHSQSVALIAEAAARTIGADAALTRVMALFHDIGKLYAPTDFAENMPGGCNPHDGRPPADSCDIIRRHVTCGMELAYRKHLPRPVRPAIEQHHGNSLIYAFYDKACQEAKASGAPPPDPSCYRYPQALPRQKEIVILALADACEAAVRALLNQRPDYQSMLLKVLEQVRPEILSGKSDTRQLLQSCLASCSPQLALQDMRQAIQRRIDQVFDGKWNDGQLAEADLTVHELQAVKRSFLDTFDSMYHFRPQYQK